MSNKFDYLENHNKSLDVSYVNRNGELVSLLNFQHNNDISQMKLSKEGNIFFNNAFKHVKDLDLISPKEFYKILNLLKIEKEFIYKHSTSKVMDFNTFAEIAKSACEKEITSFLINNTIEENIKKFNYGIKLNPLKLFIMKSDKTDFHIKLDKVFDEKTSQIDAVIINPSQTIGKKVKIKAFSDDLSHDYIYINKSILKTLDENKMSVPKIQLEKTTDRLYWIEEDLRSTEFEYIQGLVNKNYLKTEVQTPFNDYFERLTGRNINTDNLGYLYAIGTIVYEYNKKENEHPDIAFSKIEHMISNNKILDQVSKNKIVQDLYTMLAFNLQIGNEKMNMGSLNVIQDMSGANQLKLGSFKDIEPFAIKELSGDSFLNGKTLSKITTDTLIGSDFSILSKVEGFKAAWKNAKILVNKAKENVLLNQEISLAKKDEFVNYFEKTLSPILMNNSEYSQNDEKRTNTPKQKKRANYNLK